MNRREQYVQELFAEEDDILLAVKQSIIDHGMPSISVPPDLGRFLTILVKLSGAKLALEIGALGGYSGICIARGLPHDGKLTSLELNPEFAQVARANLERAGLADKVTYRLGAALSSLQALWDEGQRFDFFFIDADKGNYPQYLDFAIKLSNPGAVICADNALLGDRVIDPQDHDPSVLAMREFNQKLAQDTRLESILLPVRDGFALARVK